MVSPRVSACLSFSSKTLGLKGRLRPYHTLNHAVTRPKALSHRLYWFLLELPDWRYVCSIIEAVAPSVSFLLLLLFIPVNFNKHRHLVEVQYKFTSLTKRLIQHENQTHPELGDLQWLTAIWSTASCRCSCRWLTLKCGKQRCLQRLASRERQK